MKRSSKSWTVSTAAAVTLAMISACARPAAPPAAASLPTAVTIADVGMPYHLVDAKHPAPSSMPSEWVWLTADGAREVETKRRVALIDQKLVLREKDGEIQLKGVQLEQCNAALAKDEAKESGWWPQNRAWVLPMLGFAIGAGLTAAITVPTLKATIDRVLH